MKDRRLHLKIKIKTFTAEADIIRFEARKVRKFEKWELNHHRTTVVRDAARRNLLAYAMMRGKPYEVVEKKTSKPLGVRQFKQIMEIAQRFGCYDKEMIQQWMDDAVSHLGLQGYNAECPIILKEEKEKPVAIKARSRMERVATAIGLVR